MLKHCNFLNRMEMKMKSIKLLWCALVLGFGLNTVSAIAQGKDIHSMEPKHGGVVSESNHIEFELVVKPEGTSLYAMDHGKAVDFSEASGKVILLNGGQKKEVALTGNSTMLQGEGVELKTSAFTALTTVEFSNKKRITVRFKSK